MNSNWIGNYSFKIFALIVLILFVLGIAFLEVQFFLEQQEPSIWEKNGDLFIAEVEGFQNGTVILNLWNSGPVPVNLTEVFLKEVEVSHVKSEKLQVITSVRQEILVNTEVTVPIGVRFSTENLDFDKKYAVGVSWTTETGQGSASKTDFVFLV